MPRLTIRTAKDTHPGPTETDPGVVYLAGFFDGEGSVRYCTTPELRVNNTDLEVLMVYWRRWGGSVARTKDATDVARTQYSWMVCGERALEAVEDMIPYLREKFAQADLLLHIRKSRKQHRPPLLKILKDLKHVDSMEREAELT